MTPTEQRIVAAALRMTQALDQIVNSEPGSREWQWTTDFVESRQELYEACRRQLEEEK